MNVLKQGIDLKHRIQQSVFEDGLDGTDDWSVPVPVGLDHTNQHLPGGVFSISHLPDEPAV